ncbi:tyrosine-type recombinase/integrase [Piscirickettsia litoralis]|uniref:Tyr recombinase domain-containing protein n=1 Tax=Piscirickettsia litoralis TaxID=1891921 RepID=A0ABX2ZYI6_9GAMM|nr:tyrosine-type recombinase/integrase [Piscirickettsia litoralis]ODN41298.1 hypothetical protein BGC07_17190 [Piscirickettsia litoralis]
MISFEDEQRRFNEETKKARYAHTTQKAYESDWAQFKVYCFERGLMALPADSMTVGLYLMHLYKDKKRSRTSILRQLASINAKHQASNFPTFSDSARIKKALQAIRTTDDYRPKQAPALRFKAYHRLIANIDLTNLVGLRDALLFSWMWFGAFRKSEVIALTYADIELDESGRGVVVNIRGSKTNRENTKQQQVPLRFHENYPFCPIKLFRLWSQKTDLKSGFIICRIDKSLGDDLSEEKLKLSNLPLHPVYVNRILAQRLTQAGLPTQYSPHSFRSGFLSEAAHVGVSVQELKAVSQHSSSEIEKYIRQYNLLEDTASQKILSSHQSLLINKG